MYEEFDSYKGRFVAVPNGILQILVPGFFPIFSTINEARNYARYYLANQEALGPRNFEILLKIRQIKEVSKNMPESSRLVAFLSEQESATVTKMNLN